MLLEAEGETMLNVLVRELLRVEPPKEIKEKYFNNLYIYTYISMVLFSMIGFLGRYTCK